MMTQSFIEIIQIRRPVANNYFVPNHTRYLSFRDGQLLALGGI